MWTELENQEEAYQLLKMESDSAELRNMELEDKNQELGDKLKAMEYKITAIKAEHQFEGDTPDIAFLVGLASRAGQPSPEECLTAIQLAYPAKCEVLESAWKSASDMESFQSGRRLLDMLRRLLTDYADALDAGGDAQARMIFSTDEYSANESETVESSPTLSAKRRFVRKGQAIDMFRHLKIGKSDNIMLTLRVHFAWLQGERKIVIGYCGKHLPIASH